MTAKNDHETAKSDHENAQNTRNRSSGLHTILLVVTIGVIGWVGTTVQNLTTSMARMEVGLSTHISSGDKDTMEMKHDILDLRMRVDALEIKVAQFVRAP